MGEDGEVLCKKSEATQHRAIPVRRQNARPKISPLKLPPIRPVAPRAELSGNGREVFLSRVLEHHFAGLEKTKNVITYIHRHCTFGESRKPGNGAPYCVRVRCTGLRP